MKRTTLWACAALLTFSAGTACAVLWLLDGGAEVERLSLREEPLDAEFCHLLAVPGSYEGKLIRVRATYAMGRHGPAFTDRNCLGLDTRIWVSVGPEMWRELERAMAEVYGTGGVSGALDVVAVGRFERNRPSFNSDSLEDKAPYRFELSRVERAAQPSQPGQPR